MDHSEFWGRVNYWRMHTFNSLGQAVALSAQEMDPDIYLEVVHMVGDVSQDNELASMFFFEFNRIWEEKKK